MNTIRLYWSISIVQHRDKKNVYYTVLLLPYIALLLEKFKIVFKINQVVGSLALAKNNFTLLVYE